MPSARLRDSARFDTLFGMLYPRIHPTSTWLHLSLPCSYPLPSWLPSRLISKARYYTYVNPKTISNIPDRCTHAQVASPISSSHSSSMSSVPLSPPAMLPPSPRLVAKEFNTNLPNQNLSQCPRTFPIDEFLRIRELDVHVAVYAH